MKSGTRALGIAESHGARGPEDGAPVRSTVAGVVTKARGTVDGFSFGTCTVGGSDSTDAVLDLVDRLGREDVRYLLVSGVALAWYNLLDLEALYEGTDRPAIVVTYEESEGLEEALSAAFEGEALERRLEAYRALPDRYAVSIGEEQLFVRAVGLDTDEAASVVRSYTLAGGRPEPLRVARLAARAADQWRGNER